MALTGPSGQTGHFDATVPTHQRKAVRHGQQASTAASGVASFKGTHGPEGNQALGHAGKIRRHR